MRRADATRVGLRDGLSVLWREPGVVQIGTDPRCGVLLPGLTQGEQALLDLLERRPSLDELGRAALASQVPPARMDALLEHLDLAGVLQRRLAGNPADPSPSHPAATRSADAAYWSRLRADGDGWAVLRGRGRLCVGVFGACRTGMLVASGLAAAGVGTVILSDSDPVQPQDVAPGAFGPADVGRSREEAGAEVLRAVVPDVRTSAPPCTRPDVCVLIEHRVASPVRARPLVREDLAHLAVVARDVDVVVGPLVVPGEGPCLRCLDLHRCDADDRWPAVATQLAALPPEGVESSLASLAAALAVSQVLTHLDGRLPVTRGASLELAALDPVPRLRKWASHPSCGCARVGDES